MTEVLAVLLQLMGDGSLVIAAEPVRTTIEECLKMAFEINSNVDLPYVVFCTPDVSGVSV